MAGFAPDWEPWEVRRSSLPVRPTDEVREARQDAGLLLMVVRARFAQGEAPLEHAERLAEVAQDERLSTRRRRVAAQYLARVRMVAMGCAGGPQG